MKEATKITGYFADVETTEEHKGYFYSVGGDADNSNLAFDVRIKKRQPNTSVGGKQPNSRVFGKIL